MNTGPKNQMGRGGLCVCPKCDRRIPHIKGQPCQEQRCPTCNAKMLREGSYHHELVQKKSDVVGPKEA